MKAIVRDRYGPPDVLRVEEREPPRPGDEDVLIRVHASSLNRGDRYYLEGTPALIRLFAGLWRPRRRGVGQDFAGEVTAVGSRVADVRPGDAVYGELTFGETWAEYACVPAARVAPKPKNLDWQQAAAVPLAGMTALQGLRDHGRVVPGQQVLVNGATGSVGPFAVQIARALGATVTAVCSERNVELVRSLGAEEVVAYETTDYTTLGRRFDVIFDVAGNRPVRASRRVLRPGGVHVLVGSPDDGPLGPLGPMLGKLAEGLVVRQRVASYTQKASRADLELLTEWIEAGRVRPVIDRTFELTEAAAALRYSVEGRPAAKVVLAV